MADWRLAFKSFDSKMASREKLFKAAVEFGSQLGRERLVTLSHSEDRDNIVITLWYWTDEPEGAEAKAKTQGSWKKPEMKSTGQEKIVPTKAAASGAPVQQSGVKPEPSRLSEGKGDPVRPPAPETMEIPRQDLPIDRS